MLKSMFKMIFLAAAVTQIFSARAEVGPPVCKTTSDCLTLPNRVNTRLQELQGKMPTFLEVAVATPAYKGLTDPDNKILVTQSDAVKYCKCDSEYARNQLGCNTPPNSARLPNIRELAKLSMNFGARGIVDSCGADGNCSRVSCNGHDLI